MDTFMFDMSSANCTQKITQKRKNHEESTFPKMTRTDASSQVSCKKCASPITFGESRIVCLACGSTLCSKHSDSPLYDNNTFYATQCILCIEKNEKIAVLRSLTSELQMDMYKIEAMYTEGHNDQWNEVVKNVETNMEQIASYIKNKLTKVHDNAEEQDSKNTPIEEVVEATA